MTVDSKELNLELGCGFHPKTISDLLTQVSVIDNLPHQFSDLDELLDVLQQELKKIDAFKRELPLCMRLLNDAIVRIKEKAEQCKKRKKVAMEMEESVSLGNSEEDGGSKRSNDCADMKNWMSSCQLWSSPVIYDSKFDRATIHESFRKQKPMNEKEGKGIAKRSLPEKWDDNSIRDAYVALKEHGEAKVKIEDDLAADGLSLSFPVATGTSGTSGCGVSGGSSPLQQGKKQRRCWSPDLHRRFTHALQQLGGAHTATPKQIRELMQVEGLTNDEVKSHLQKYRLHVRKLPSCSSAPLNLDWLRREHSYDFQASKTKQTGSSDGPFQVGGLGKKAFGEEEGEVRKPCSERLSLSCN